MQNYQDSDWKDLVSLWKFYNLHIIQIIRNIDKTKLGNKWTDYEGNVVTLNDMIASYLWHLRLHTNEIDDIINNRV
ncbi:hypothetical protein D0T84_16795 [Dysgonomonas sp. 521]|uniref:hypothetical protein n=1 Tax=Dysgonomonas sp. 521 TaxID=2302932 RepID=UPI0013D69FD1|nr:hypothetical protein [Dysgonomonas sp. 521]NDV96560.1 hypothetical protein [Dysgonomonas sp. 521]